MSISGVWLPIITPFKDGELDLDSYTNLINHYIPLGISGIIPIGTTGETPVLSEKEAEKVIETTMEVTNKRVPVYAGIGGNYTQKVTQSIKTFEKYGIEGILSVCPYYNRPNQEGIFQHFKALSESTALNILIYNIPYRTGINLTNDSLLHLAEFKNIIGVKDSSGDIHQSLELLYQKPSHFSVLTGEDLMFYTTLVNGGDGGILASSHLETKQFVDLFQNTKANNHQAALKIWKALVPFIRLLFAEPNPAPLKYCLKLKGLIQSEEVRLPLVEISENLQKKLESIFQN